MSIHDFTNHFHTRLCYHCVCFTAQWRQHRECTVNNLRVSYPYKLPGTTSCYQRDRIHSPLGHGECSSTFNYYGLHHSRPFISTASPSSLGSAGGSFGTGRFNSLATCFAAQKPVTNASARPPEYPKLLNPPASTPATRRPGIRLLSGVKAWPSLSILIPPYVNVILRRR